MRNAPLPIKFTPRGDEQEQELDLVTTDSIYTILHIRFTSHPLVDGGFPLTTPSSAPYEVPGFFSVNVPAGWTTYVEGKSYHFKLSADVGIIITDSDNSTETELEQAERADHAKRSSPALLYKKHRLLNLPNEHIAADSQGNPRHAVALVYEEESPDTHTMRYVEKLCFRHYVNGTPVAAFLTITRPLDNFRSYENDVNTFLSSLKWTDR